MNWKKGKKVHTEIILLVLVSIYCVLAPNRDNCTDSNTWISDIIGWVGSLRLFTAKVYFFAPLWWGILCYILLKCIRPYLKEHGIKLLIDNKVCKVLIRIITIVFLMALAYMTCGFILYVVLPPMPFLVGYYIMNHPIILGICWCIEAVLIYLSFEK